jgi:hypothetical protein
MITAEFLARALPEKHVRKPSPTGEKRVNQHISKPLPPKAKMLPKCINRWKHNLSSDIRLSTEIKTVFPDTRKFNLMDPEGLRRFFRNAIFCQLGAFQRGIPEEAWAGLEEMSKYWKQADILAFLGISAPNINAALTVRQNLYRFSGAREGVADRALKAKRKDIKGIVTEYRQITGVYSVPQKLFPEPFVRLLGELAVEVSPTEFETITGFPLARSQKFREWYEDNVE